jgi:hypothetical protein
MRAPIENVIRSVGRLLEGERFFEEPDDVRRQTADRLQDLNAGRTGPRAE